MEPLQRDRVLDSCNYDVALAGFRVPFHRDDITVLETGPVLAVATDNQVPLRPGMEPLADRCRDPHHGLALVYDEWFPCGDLVELIGLEHREAFAQELDPSVHSLVDPEDPKPVQRAEVAVDT